MDLIDRQEAIDDLHGRDPSQIWDTADIEVWINALPSAQLERWIPTTEKLPKYGKTVIITNDKGNVRCGRFEGVEFWKDDGDSYWTFKGNTVEHVLAWMPLPEPYKGEQ